MGLPEIIINFKTAGTTALRRSSRGAVAMIVGGQGTDAVFTALSQADAAALGARLYRMLRLCFLGTPAKVTVIYGGNGSDALDRARRAASGGWICAPDMAASAAAAYIREQRALGEGVRAVVGDASAPDCEGVVNFCADGLQVALDGAPESISTAEYCARIAGLLAGLSLERSATYIPLPEVTDFIENADPDGDIERGKLILCRGGSGARLARAVNSLTTVTAGKGAAFQKIKIIEGLDLIRSDIRRAFEEDYIGRALNDYDSKLLLVTAINGYFDELSGTVLDASGSNEAFIDFEAQQSWLRAHGINTDELTEQQILSANTGSSVFLGAAVRFADAMEDLRFSITM